MDSPSSAIAAGDGSAIGQEKVGATGQEKVGIVEGNKPKSPLMENGWHGYELMRNGNPRPSAVREYPEGIVALHRRKTDSTGEFLASDKDKQINTLPKTSKDKSEHKQNEKSIGATADREGINLIVELNEHGKEVRSVLKTTSEQKGEKTSNHVVKKVKAEQRVGKSADNASPSSNKLDKRKTGAAEPVASKKETDLKQSKAKVSSAEDVPQKLLKSGKSTEVKRSAATVSQDLAANGSGVKEETTMSKTQKVVATSSVVSAAGQEIEQSGLQEQIDVSEVARKQPELALEKEGELGKEKVVDSNTEDRSIKKKPGGQDISQSVIGPSDQEKSQEKDAIVAVSAPEAIEKSELNTDQGKETMDLDKDENTEKGLGQPEQEKVVDKSAKVEPAKRKSGPQDVSSPVSPQAKKKPSKEGVGHEISSQDLRIKAPPSKVTGTSKEKAIAENAKSIGKTEIDNGKPGGIEKKKRPLEVPNSGEKSKKLPKVKSSKDENSPLKAKEKQSGSETKVQEMGTHKEATKKPSTPSQASKKPSTPSEASKKPTTPSEPSKKVRRSGGKPARPVTFAGDVGNARNLVMESLRLYDSVRRKLLQDEEKNGKQGRASRADLQAATFLKDQNTVRGPEKAHGALPGVLVGDIYLFRTELSFIRVHGPIQGGIEYLTVKDSEFSSPVAISIISNVGQDGEDDGENFVYTGQGGRSADNKQVADQKLERGNLAMDGSRKFNVPVRVIRGIKDTNSHTGKIYVYDGLYDVQETYTEKGSGGFDEFKFRLQRRTDQPELASNLLKLAVDLKNKSPSIREDVVIADISKGKESQVISVENAVDKDKGPAEFQYATKLVYSKDLVKPEAFVGCKCSGGCTPTGNCSCFTQNGDEFVYLNGGYLVREKDFVFECGSSCSCSSSCRNRAPEVGIKFRLDIFKTEDKGWGVRALELIPAGSFVCEYVGKVVSDKQNAKEASDRKYMLTTSWLPERTPKWGETSNLFADRPPSLVMPDAGKSDLIIDASDVGNVARFINHSCSPNLLVQKVLSEHQDIRYPHFKFFAIDNIPSMKELTIDYGYPSQDQEPGTEQIICRCGSPDCRGKLYV